MYVHRYIERGSNDKKFRNIDFVLYMYGVHTKVYRLACILNITLARARHADEGRTAVPRGIK